MERKGPKQIHRCRPSNMHALKPAGYSLMKTINRYHISVRNDHGKGLHLLQACSLVPGFVLLVLLTIGWVRPANAAPEPAREIVVEGRRFAYDPPIIRVKTGDRIRLVLRSMDVTHGLYLEGYGVSMQAIPGKEVQAEFIAEKGGKFTFRCNRVCGNLHPFMTGSLIVTPNQPLWAALIMAGLLSLGFFGYIVFNHDTVEPGAGKLEALNASPRPIRPQKAIRKATIGLDLTRNKLVSWLVNRRAFQFALLLPTFFALVLVLVAGFSGSPVGDHNLAIVLLWGLWWPLLILVLIPLGGRAWCVACPVPAPGEWLQRLAVVRKREGNPFSLTWSWPRRLRNMWPQNIAFLTVAALSAVVLTSPTVTAITLAAFVGLAMLMALLFRGRSFCHNVCPLGGFIGLYAVAAPFSLKARDREICQAHKDKSCIEGNQDGYGCPWYQYPGTMESGSHCGLCMECVKTCPKENLAVGFQAPGRDLIRSQGRPDEAFRAIILLSAALVYTIVMLGPWGWLKTWAGNPATAGFLLYIGLLLGFSLLLVPGLVLGSAYLFKRFSGTDGVTTKQTWTGFSYSLIPLGLLVWITFAATALSAGVAHLPSVVSDPLGQGWDLFGTAGDKWPPLYPRLLPYLQIGTLLAGLAWSLVILRGRVKRLLRHWGRRAKLGLVPMIFILFGITSVFIWLFLG